MVPSFPMRCRHCGETVDSDLLAVGGHTCNQETKKRYMKREKRREREQMLVRIATLKTYNHVLKCMVILAFALGFFVGSIASPF